MSLIRSNIGIIVVCLLFLLVGSLCLNQMIIYTPDSARYIVWANSLAKFEGFKDISKPEPARYVVHAPLYSVLLTPSAFFFSNSVVAAKVTTLLLGCLAIFFLFVWLKRIVGEKYAILGSVLLALNPLMLIYSTQVLSDIPFILCIILFFLFAEKLNEEGHINGKTEAVFIVIVVTGIFLREVGLTLMLGATTFFLWKKQYRRASLVFLISLLFYLLWFVRNEVIVAGVEIPSTRNTQIFFTHLYTPRQATLLEEFSERFWSNISIYKTLVGKLLLIPEFALRSHALISTKDPLIAFLFKVLPVAQFILVGVTLGFLVIGILFIYKKTKKLPLIIIFLLCYLVPIVFYPINDIRFLFPIAVVMIYFSVIGLKQVLEWCYERVTSIAVRQVMTGILFLLLLPNTIWIQNYIRNNLLYAQWHDNIPKELENESRRPELFAKPLHLAAKWIVQHSDSSAVILSRWKELSLWLDGRKVLEANTQITPDQFNQYLRDYNVKYIVTIFWWSAISEFEALFIRSERFIFLPVYRIGNVEIFEVKSKDYTYRESKTTLSDSSIGSLYDEALRLMENDPTRSELILKVLAERTEGLGSVIIYLGVAKELAGQLDSAATLFKKFRELQQAGAYVEQASYHQEIIARIKLAESAVNPTECAERFHIVAINYWELGYRKQAMKMLIRSLEADPYFFPSLIFYALFSFQQGDNFSTTKYLEKAQLLQPANILVTGLNSIRRCIDSSKVTTSSIRRLELQFKIIDSYIAMGLRENAIDDLLEILREDPANQKALSLIARMYEVKRRFAPALQMYKRLVMASPTDTTAQMKLQELSDRFQ